MKKVCCCLIALGLLLSVGQTAWALGYQVRDLGTLPGHAYATVNAMNNHQEIVGYSNAPSMANHGFYWSDATGMVDLGEGQAGGINNLGQVVGWSTTQNRSYTWSRQTGFTYGPSDVHYYKINDAGQIAGIGADYAGFLIAADGTRTLIDDGYSVMAISGLNQSGRVCGAEFPTGPFIWSVSTGYIGVSPLPGRVRFPEDIRRGVTGLNDSGIAVGQSLNADDYRRAVRWNANGGQPSLLAAVPGALESVACGINNAGVIVGFSTIQDSTACVWYPDGTVQGLGYLPGSSSSHADFVNGDGYIAGLCNDGTTDHIVLWTPVPEPSTILALLAGLGSVGGMLIVRKK